MIVSLKRKSNLHRENCWLNSKNLTKSRRNLAARTFNSHPWQNVGDVKRIEE